jgi:tagatose bisphosphate family class II aldolase
MSLISSKKMLKDAMKNSYAIAAFNIHNLETLKAVTMAAQQEQAPVILQTTPGTCRYAGVNFLYAMAKAAAEEFTVPIALHLDHGDCKELAIKCIDSGYTSIMIDGSNLSFEQNIALIKDVAGYAHRKGIQFEAELGRISGVEEENYVREYEQALTDPEKVEEYVNRTGIDSLAVAIGTAHGIYKGEPKLDFVRLGKIREYTDIPLVLHGCSGVPDEMIRKAISLGVNKINIATEIKIAFADALKQHFKMYPGEHDPRKYFKQAQEALMELVKSKIRLAGASGKASNYIN